jgi:transcriptional regulator
MQEYAAVVMVHPWDAAVDKGEWRAWLAAGRDFGQLIVNDPAGWPAVVPTHFTVDDERTVLMHLARPNRVWRLIEAQPRVVLAVVDDDAYIPNTWRAAPDAAREGVPTSYYAAVQLCCRAEIVDDPGDKAELLRRQLGSMQPEHDHAPVAVDEPPYGRLLPGIRGLRLHVVDVVAKFKFDDHKSAEHRLAVADRLQQRGQGHDHGARAQQLRRLDTSQIGPT